MTRKEQIKKSLEILGIPADGPRAEGARKHIASSLDWPPRTVRPIVTETKAHKAAARQLAQALRRFEIALKNPSLAGDVFMDSRRLSKPAELLRFLSDVRPLDEIDWGAIRKTVEATANRKLGVPKRRDKVAKREAAENAADLLLWYGLPLRLTRKTSKFCRLAAVLYGDERADLYAHCCSVKPEIIKYHINAKALFRNPGERHAHLVAQRVLRNWT